MAGGHIQISDLSKNYGDVLAVDHIDLEMVSGEFFSMLGPSGCGKTTTLRMIAGFEEPSSGQILLDGTDIRHTPAHKRPVNTVFQAYMIFPHLNVYDNVAFGLKRQRVGKEELRKRVGAALDLVQLQPLAKRKPSQLSGGQQQRVALARALVLEPAVLLLDEPLGALDAKLRHQLQEELKSLQQAVGITFAYVTHDQEEALTMSDRIAVMSNGLVEQIGTPREVYDEPTTEFVADFLGISNMIDGQATPDGGGVCRLQVGDFTLLAAGGDTGARGAARCVVRPERVRLEPHTSTGENRIPGQVERLVYLGNATRAHVRLATGQTVTALVQSDGQRFPFDQGSAVQVELPADGLRLLKRTGHTDADALPDGPGQDAENAGSADHKVGGDEPSAGSQTTVEGSAK